MTSRRAFYPVPPSEYPKPLIDPAPAMETTYAHHHAAHTVKDSEFYRSRTLNPYSSLASSSAVAVVEQTIYPLHGTGNFILPYFRRDSKGFRKQYTQPVHVDENYASYTAHSRVERVANSGSQWAHPSSRPTYAAQFSNRGGTQFVTSYRNSGLYDSLNAAHTKRVSEVVADELAQARLNRTLADIYVRNVTEEQRAALGHAPAPSASTSSSSSSLAATARPWSSPSSQQQLFHPSATSSASSSLSSTATTTSSSSYAAATARPSTSTSTSSTSAAAFLSTDRTILQDPLLEDPIANAYRKPRTVYKRAYGYCM